MQANQNVLDCRHFTKELNVLEGTRNTREGDIGRSFSNNTLACIQHITCGRNINTSQHVHHGALTGAVWSDQTMNRAALNTEVYIIECFQPAELHQN